MLELLSVNENMLFTVSLAIMLGIALLEGVASLLGAGLSAILDSMLPDLNADIHIDTDMHAGTSIDGSEVVATSALSQFWSWLRIGEVPVLVLLVILLTSFGILGLILQSIFNSMFGTYLPGIVAAIPAFMMALPCVRVLGGGIKAIMPKDQTEAISEDSLVGRVATITLGRASKGNPAQAKVIDQFGMSHYLMVEPAEEDVIFSAHQKVLLIRNNGAVFAAIENTHQSMVDE